MHARIRSVCLLLLILGISRPLWATDLLQIYELAQENDPVVHAAKEAQLAAAEARPQALAGFLPTAQATATTGQNTTRAAGPTGTQSPVLNSSYKQSAYGLMLTQPVFYYQQWVQFHKASAQVKAAQATYAAAEQHLIVRTVQAYFKVLGAVDALAFAHAQRKALSQYLAQTKQRYQAGLIAMTDVQIAKAQRDSAYAEEITASNAVQNAYEQLREITGQPVDRLITLRAQIPLDPPTPQALENWVQSALTHNFQLQALRYQTEATRTAIRLSQAAHLPSVDVHSSLTHDGSTPLAPRNTHKSLGLQLTFPLFSGGLIRSQTKAAVHVYEQAQKDLETLHKTLESQTRQAYRGVLTQISQATALQQAIVSNRSALKATEASFNVGSRTIVDVLNAQTNLIAAERNYANARYAYILQSVQLKEAAGILEPNDLLAINGLLARQQ